MNHDQYWKKVWSNVKLSARYGAGGGRLKDLKTNLGHELTITIDDIKSMWDSQDGKCHWLGIDMSLEDVDIKNSPFAPSVERLDSTIGYVPGNVVLASRFANRGRGAYDNEDFKDRLTSLLEKRQDGN